jgi:hypothetical protein
MVVPDIQIYIHTYKLWILFVVNPSHAKSLISLAVFDSRL